MNWLPTRPGWLEFHDPDPTGITARARCEYEGINGQECRNEPTHLATWPSTSHSPMTKFYCGSHVASVERVPGATTERLD